MKQYKFIKPIIYLLSVLLIGLTIRLLFIGIYMVASGSMEQTMYKDDIVLVNKYAYGARLSQEMGDLPLLTLFDSWFGIKKASVDIRVPKTGEINREDIVVFNHPYRRDKLVKRCTGLPGDTFEISHNIRYINGQPQQEPKETRYSYKIWSDDNNTFLYK